MRSPITGWALPIYARSRLLTSAVRQSVMFFNINNINWRWGRCETVYSWRIDDKNLSVDVV